MSHEPKRVTIPLPGHPGIILEAGTYDDLISTGEQLVRAARQAQGKANQAVAPFAGGAQSMAARVGHPSALGPVAS